MGIKNRGAEVLVVVGRVSGVEPGSPICGLQYISNGVGRASDMCEWYSSPKIVLLDTGVAPLRDTGVTRVTAGDVHADHVPQVALKGPSVVVVIRGPGR